MKNINRRSKLNNFYFTESTNAYIRSTLSQAYTKKNHVLNPIKYRSIKEERKMSYRLYGASHPTTIEIPKVPRFYKTLVSSSWSSKKSNLSTENFLLINSTSYHKY